MGRWLLVVVVVLGCKGAPGMGAPHHPELRRGDAAFERHQYRNAAYHYRRALVHVSYHYDEGYYERYGLALFLARKYDECIREVQDIGLQVYESSTALRDVQALCLWGAGREREAIEQADRIVRLDPTRFRLQLMRGKYYFGRDAEACVEAFEGYLAARPDELAKADAGALLELGHCYLGARKPVDATRVFRAALAKYPPDTERSRNALLDMCSYATRNQLYELAIEVCGQVTDLDHTAWLNIATAHHALGHHQRALTAVDEFFRREPHSARGLELRARILETVEGNE